MDHISSNIRPFPISAKASRNARSRRKLTPTALKGLPSRAERYEVGDPDMPGLQVRVDALLADGSPGAKSWQWRFSWKGKRQKFGLGIWPAVSQARAHNLVREARALLERGIDPRQAGLTRERSVPTVASDPQGKPIDPNSVEAVAADFMKRFIIPHRKRPEQVQRTLDADILPHWLGRDVRTIKPRDVIAILDIIVDRGSRTMANRTAAILTQMFKYAIQRNYIEVSPVQLLFPPGGREKKGKRALDDAEIAALLGCLDDVFIRAPTTAIVIRLVLLTGFRRSELVLAKWSDIDLDGDAPLWRIPIEHSKTDLPYLNPLTPAAVEQFRRLKARAGRSRYVMPALDGDGPLEPRLVTRSVKRHLKTLAKNGVAAFTLRDLRRTLRTGLSRLKNENGSIAVLPHIAERVLNHAQETIEGTYDVHEYLDEKRAALEQWANHLAGLTAKP